MWGWNHTSRVWPGPRVAVTASANQWDLGDNGTSDRPSHLAGMLVLGVVSAWVDGRDPRPVRRGADALGYVAGVVVADRLGPRLGMPTRLGASDLAAITSSLSLSVTPGPDPGPFGAGFGAGLRDHRLADSPSEIYGLVGREVPDHHREVLQRRLGVPGLGRLLSTLAG